MGRWVDGCYFHYSPTPLAHLSHLSKIPTAKDRFGVGVELKLQEILKRVLQKECPVFQRQSGKAMFGLLKELEILPLGPLQQGFPICLGGEDQSKVAGIDACLLHWFLIGDMGHQLMSIEIQNYRVWTLSPHFAA